MKEFVSRTKDVSLLFDKDYFVTFLDKQMYQHMHQFDLYISDGGWDYKNNISDRFLYRLIKTYTENRWLDYDILDSAEYIYQHYESMSFLTAVKVQYKYTYLSYTNGNNSPVIVEDADKTLEVKIARMLYGRFAKANLLANQNKHFTDFINTVITNLTPTPVVEESEDWDDSREESEDDVQPDLIEPVTIDYDF